MEPTLDHDSPHDMFDTVQGWHTTQDCVKLYTKSWRPKGDIKAQIVFVHGFSDHCNASYDVLFADLARRNIAVHAYDQRGWGLSVHKHSERGNSGPTSQVMSDMAEIISTHLPSKPFAPAIVKGPSPTAPATTSPPLFVYGHSMGGGQTLTFASPGTKQNTKDIRSQIRGYIAEAPFVKLAPHSAPFQITVISGRIASKFLPKMHMENKLDVKYVSRDPAVGMKYRDDPLCHDTGTLESLAGMLDRGAHLVDGRVKVSEEGGWKGENGDGFGVLVAHGSGDMVCDFGASQAWLEDDKRCAVKDKRFVGYEGWYHQLHSEPDDDNHRYARMIGDWILERS